MPALPAFVLCFFPFAFVLLELSLRRASTPADGEREVSLAAGALQEALSQPPLPQQVSLPAETQP